MFKLTFEFDVEIEAHRGKTRQTFIAISLL